MAKEFPQDSLSAREEVSVISLNRLQCFAGRRISQEWSNVNGHAAADGFIGLFRS